MCLQDVVDQGVVPKFVGMLGTCKESDVLEQVRTAHARAVFNTIPISIWFVERSQMCWSMSGAHSPRSCCVQYHQSTLGLYKKECGLKVSDVLGQVRTAHARAGRASPVCYEGDRSCERPLLLASSSMQ